MRRRRRSKFTNGVVLFLILPVMACCGLCVRYEPVFRAYAINQAQYTATQAINKSITTELSKKSESYQNLITLERDNESHVTALKTDALAMSMLKADTVQCVFDCMDSLEEQTIYVPIGSIVAPSYMGGRGPKIPVGMAGLGIARADLVSAFSAAGINQTRHNIVLEVTADVNVLLPIGSQKVEVSSKFNLTDTVIVGTVPGQYTYIDDTEQSLLGKINDYGE